MTSEKLYATIKFFDSIDAKFKVQKSLVAVRDALNNLVSQPAQPQYQTALANALGTFEVATDQLAASLTPSQLAAIESMGGAEFFDASMAEKVERSIQTSAMTPSVARDFVQDLTTKREAFLETLSAARKNLEKLGIEEAALQPGEADVAFLIPRDIFQNQLGEFAKELKYINQFIEHASEALMGHLEPVELEQLSSSVPTIVLFASAPVISYVADIVNKFLDSWKKIEEIREIRGRLSEMGLKRHLEELTEVAETTVDEVVEEAVELVLINYKGELGRKNELSTAVGQDVRRLFGQIERGLKVEFRAVPAKEEESDNGKALAKIADLSRALQFPQVAREPLLLKGEEVIEGEIQALKVNKKTTAHKTSTSKRTVSKKNGQPAVETTS